MAPQADRLVKVGLEGFALIDECYGRSRRVSSSYQGTQPCVYHGPQVVTLVKVPIGHDEAVQFYGAAPYIYQGPQVSQKEAVLDSNRAAQCFGGLAIIDYRTKKF